MPQLKWVTSTHLNFMLRGCQTKHEINLYRSQDLIWGQYSLVSMEVFYMKWESWPRWIIMNGHKYSVCSAAMWPQGGELELHYYFLDLQQQATGSMETGCVCRLNRTGQRHCWTQPFQCIRQNGNDRYSDALCLTTRILNMYLDVFLIFVIKLPVHFFF